MPSLPKSGHGRAGERTQERDRKTSFGFSQFSDPSSGWPGAVFRRILTLSLGTLLKTA